MAENEQPPAPPAAVDTSAPSKPEVPPQAQAAPLPEMRQEDDAPAGVAEDLLPTVRDHAERVGLTRTQTDAVIARLHGEHDEDGKRRFAHGASLNTRMSDEDFDAAADVAFHGRI